MSGPALLAERTEDPHVVGHPQSESQTLGLLFALEFIRETWRSSSDTWHGRLTGATSKLGAAGSSPAGRANSSTMTIAVKQPGAPLTYAVIAALARLVDDAQSAKRQPSHSEIQDQFTTARRIGIAPRSRALGVGSLERGS